MLKTYNSDCNTTYNRHWSRYERLHSRFIGSILHITLLIIKQLSLCVIVS
nr:MAG TPA: hypothetical protein [Bacteriophage sp.]